MIVYFICVRVIPHFREYIIRLECRETIRVTHIHIVYRLNKKSKEQRQVNGHALKHFVQCSNAGARIQNERKRTERCRERKSS